MAILRYREYLPDTLVKVYGVNDGANENDLSEDDLIIIGYYLFGSPKSTFIETYDCYNMVTKSKFMDTDFFDTKSGMDNFKHYYEKI